MGDKLVIGPIKKGLKTDVTAFNIDNDNFPMLINAYQWRGRAKRKRGTEFFGRLTRYFNSLLSQFNPGTTTQNLASGAGNLLTGFTSSGIQSSATLAPGTITINDTTATVTYTDDSMGNLVGAPSGTGTVNYSSGDFTIVGGATDTIDANFDYYPNLPVLGLEPFAVTASEFPGELGFDKTYSYNIGLSYNTASVPYLINDVTFYNNPASNGGIGYTQKTKWTPFTWNFQNYQQVWTTNYQGALWAVPGFPTPFASTNISMQFKKAATTTQITSTTVTFTITEAAAVLVTGDWIFVNEFTVSNAPERTLSLQTGFISSSVTNNGTTTTFTATFPNASIASVSFDAAHGIIQYLTNTAYPLKDCIRFYNGAPVSSTIPPVFSAGQGWVNFAPPLTTANFSDFSIDDAAPAQYYLVSARMVVPFKDRLLFFGPVIQASSGNPIYLQDAVIYSQNGTPYYTASFTSTSSVYPPNPTITYFPYVVPTNQTAQPSSFFENLSGYGGYVAAGYARPITSVSPNEDVLIVGFSDRQARLAYTGNDIVPFNFYIVNSELGSESTFSTITLDRGVMSVGGRGIILTTQVGSERIDLDVIDQVFQISLLANGSRRVCAQRDFINEWVYFTYPSNANSYVFPTQTLQYNYRDNSWAIFDESYTTYGLIRKQTGLTWATCNFPWSSWNSPWNSGDSTALQPLVLAGNQQGFLLTRAEDGTTNEGTSLYITNIDMNGVVSSLNHCLNNGDYIVINGVLGTIGSLVNGQIFSVANASASQFTLNAGQEATVPPFSGTYLGGGLITRMYVPFVQSRQFPVAWEMARKVRIGAQQYLFTTTNNGQVTLLIFLSQNASSAYNTGSIVPTDDPEPINNSLIYSTVLYTCPEYSLTGATLNLGSLGDGSQTSFTINLIPNIFPGSLLITVGSVATFQDNCIGGFTVTGTGSGGTIAYASGIVTITFSAAPASQSSKATYQYKMFNLMTPTAAQQAQIWHRMNTSLIGDTVQFGITLSDAQMRDPTFSNQFAEIEFHAAILDLNPSQMLV